MKRIGIQIEETLKYVDEIVVIQPDGMSDEVFEKLMETADEMHTKRINGGAKDFAAALSQLGLKVEDRNYNFPNNPNHSVIDLINVRAIE